MKTVIKILFTQFVAMYWKKFISLTVVGSLLFSLIVSPFAHAYSVRSEMGCLESKQRAESSSRPERYKLRKASELIEGGRLASKASVLALAAKHIPVERLKDGSVVFSKRIQEQTSLRPDQSESTMKQYDRNLEEASQRDSPFLQKNFSMDGINRARARLARYGINSVSAKSDTLSGSRFRISSLRSAIGSITSLHAGRIGRAIERRIGGSIERLTSLGGRRIWDYIESMTALHAGPILMHLRTIKDNYSLLHIPPTILNVPQPFAYLFRAALDGNRDQGNKATSYRVSPARKDDKWEYITETGAMNPYLFPKLLTRIMEVYVEEWRVLGRDFKIERKVDGKWVDIIQKADRTTGDYHVTPRTEEEDDLIGKFNKIYDELIGFYYGEGDEYNTKGEYPILALDHVFVGLYDGPGFIWSEDVFQLAYYYTRVEKLTDFTRRHANPYRKDENYEREGHFNIDRRYAHILMEYGKKHGEEALMKLIRAHAVRELELRSKIHSRPAGGKGPYMTYDMAHDAVLDKPEQKELMEFARKAANDIRLGDFEDYILVRDLIDTWDRISAIPENKIGVFGEYLISLYLTVKAGRDYAPRDEKTLKDIFLLIRRDKELYLEYRSQIEELLGRNRDATRDELEAIKKQFIQRLKEKEKEGVIRSFALRYPRFARMFGPEMIVNNIEALLDFEQRVEKEVENKRWTTPGELIFDIFSQMFRTVEKLVTPENFMEVAEDLFKVMRMYREALSSNHVMEPRNELGFMMKFFGAKRAKKKFHQMVGFCSKIPVFGWYLFEKRIRLEEHLRWLHPDTYRRMEEEKKYNSSVHWMKRMRDEHLETWYGWILFFVTLSAGQALAYDGTAINALNETSKAIVSLLPYLTVGQALKGIVEENPVRLFINRADLKREVKDIKRLLDQNNGEKVIEPVITINREYKEDEETEVKIELRNHGIDIKRVKIIDQPMTVDGKFSLKVLFADHPELIEDGYSLWVLNTQSWIELIAEVLNPMELMNGGDLVELDMKAKYATDTAQ
ncbi:MAG: hypothetical protein HYT97_07870 [Elusimicrobia bacterium]|nr:hypothetical protein [Elusimicrobiota bacterium]